MAQTKTESYAYLEREGFNQSRFWHTLAALMVDPFEGLVAIRSLGRAGRNCEYDIPKRFVPRRVEAWLKNGYREEQLHFSECMEDSAIDLQGEVMRSARYLTLTFSLMKRKMRLALQQALYREGLAAAALLQSRMDAASWDDLQRIWDDYPEGIVEFSIYQRDMGIVPGRNTLFWEVRTGY